MITHSTAFEGRKLSSPIADIWSEVPRTLDEVAVPHLAIIVYFEPEKKRRFVAPFNSINVALI